MRELIDIINRALDLAESEALEAAGPRGLLTWRTHSIPASGNDAMTIYAEPGRVPVVLLESVRDRDHGDRLLDGWALGRHIARHDPGSALATVAGLRRVLIALSVIEQKAPDNPEIQAAVTAARRAVATALGIRQ